MTDGHAIPQASEQPRRTNGPLDVRFRSEGELCSAWLLRPERAGPLPCVVMAHGFGGVRGAGMSRFAEKFCEAGLAVLTFDYRRLGASSGSPRQVVEYGAQVADLRAAVAYARSLSFVDPRRIALWGFSLGGGYVLELASTEPEIAAVVLQAPFTDGTRQVGTTSLWVSLRTVVAAVRDRVSRACGGAPRLIPLVGPPGSFAAMANADALRDYPLLGEEDPTWRNEVSAGIFLTLFRHRPGRRADRIRAPLLVCVSERDEIILADAAVEAGLRAPLGEVRRYPTGHFGQFFGDCFRQSASDQVRFLMRHIGAPEREESKGSQS